MIEREVNEKDLDLISSWLIQSTDWIDEEGLLKSEVDSRRTGVWMSLYDHYDGKWLIWKENDEIKGISFHILNTPSNQIPWLGMVMVDPHSRREGFGTRIVQMLSDIISREGHSIVFAACPFEQIGWLKFLSACGFEQIGTETSAAEKRYIKLAKPL